VRIPASRSTLAVRTMSVVWSGARGADGVGAVAGSTTWTCAPERRERGRQGAEHVAEAAGRRERRHLRRRHQDARRRLIASGKGSEVGRACRKLSSATRGSRSRARGARSRASAIVSTKLEPHFLADRLGE
jgi:hypothetical protein